MLSFFPQKTNSIIKKFSEFVNVYVPRFRLPPQTIEFLARTKLITSIFKLNLTEACNNTHSTFDEALN